MSFPHHDHPQSPDGIDPADLDLYALDALPEDEADAVEQAITSADPDVRDSMLAHIASTREVVAGMVADADLDVDPPVALRARVLADVAAAGAGRQAAGGGSASGGRDGAGGGAGSDDDNVRDLGRARRSRRSAFTAVAAVAAAVILVVGGVVLGRLTVGTEQDLPSATPPTPTMPQPVSEMLAAPDLEMHRGQIAGAGSATVLASQSTDMAVITMNGLTDPGEGRAYQLWFMSPEHDPIPAGTMESGEVEPSTTAQLPGVRGAAQIGLTEEPAGGSPAPTGDVLMAVDLG